MTKPTDFSKCLTDFLGLYLPGERGVSTNTVLAYKDTFVLFLNFARDILKLNANHLTLEHITQQSVIAFLEWLEQHRKSCASTRNARLAAIHSFFTYLQYKHPVQLHEWQKILSIPHKKGAKPGLNYLGIDAIKLLLLQPDQFTSKGRRDLALMSLMYDSGARVQEAIDLMPSCMNFNRPYTIKLTGKGNKSRIVPLMESQVELLRRYMDENSLFEPFASGYMFFGNSRHEKLTRMGITWIIKKHVNKASASNPSLFPHKVTPHVLRHSKAMHLLQAGVNLIYIRDFLGHESINTTEIYARADSKMKREALERVYQNVQPTPQESALWMQDGTLLEWLKSLK